MGCSRLKCSNNNSTAKIQNLDSSADVLTSISDDKSLAIFNTIALTGGDSSILISKINLTRKQYYSRLNSLTNSHKEVNAISGISHNPLTVLRQCIFVSLKSCFINHD